MECAAYYTERAADAHTPTRWCHMQSSDEGSTHSDYQWISTCNGSALVMCMYCAAEHMECASYYVECAAYYIECAAYDM